MKKITCGKCGRTSYNPNDVKAGFCGNCHDWTNGVVTNAEPHDPGPGPKPEWAEGNPLVKVRTCAYCGEKWWEHDHSVVEFIAHMKDKHPEVWAEAERKADERRRARD